MAQGHAIFIDIVARKIEYMHRTSVELDQLSVWNLASARLSARLSLLK